MRSALASGCRFCGGALCKYCGNPQHWKDNAFLGLYSSWVVERQVLAMQRPSAELMERYSLVEAFRYAGISCIVCLQEVNEHAGCGPGVMPSTGLSYDPEIFMRAGFSFFHMGWPDMDIPTFARALDIARIIASEAAAGRGVAVHCHAGLGRTGLAIACYLMYSRGVSSNEAIIHVRSRRNGSIQNKKQVTFLNDFSHKLVELKAVLCGHVPQAGRHSLEDVIEAHRRFFYGDEQKILVPKILSVCSKLVNEKIPKPQRFIILDNILRRNAIIEKNHEFASLLLRVKLPDFHVIVTNDNVSLSLEVMVYYLLRFLKNPVCSTDALLTPGEIHKMQIEIIRQILHAFEMGPETEIEHKKNVLHLITRCHGDGDSEKVRSCVESLVALHSLSSAEIKRKLSTSKKESSSLPKD